MNEFLFELVAKLVNPPNTRDLRELLIYGGGIPKVQVGRIKFLIKWKTALSLGLL